MVVFGIQGKGGLQTAIASCRLAVTRLTVVSRYPVTWLVVETQDIVVGAELSTKK